MVRARFRPPLWFELLIALLGAWFVSWLAATYPPAPHASGALPDFETHGAWLFFLSTLAGWIWNGIQAAGQLTLSALAATVHFLWEAAKELHNGLIELGGSALRAFRAAWGFVRQLYEKILLPAWHKFWRVVDWARRSLHDLFAPIFRVLRKVRDLLLDWYAGFVRPVLDTIDVARSVLHILGKLGIEWAQRLDAELGEIEAKIDEAYRRVLRKVNEAINAVNRVVTADGLFQRLALVRSIERDIVFVHREFLNAWHRPLTDADRKQLADTNEPKSFEAMVKDAREYLDTGDGANAALIDELTAQARIELGGA